MRNPFTFVVESSLGAFFISLSAILFISILFISIKNFNSELEILSTDYSQISSPERRSNFITPSEKVLISSWANEGGIKAPEGRAFYKYMLERYPDRPWLKTIE